MSGNVEQQQQQQKKEQEENAALKITWNPNELFQDLLKQNIIPESASCEWSDLGIQLDISSDRLKKIEKDVNQEDVVVSTKKMLTDWKRRAGKASELIKAIDDCDLKAYAGTLREELGDKEEFSEKYLLNQIAPTIATEWKDIGIQLGILNLDNYAQKVNLTDEKFKRMLKEWLTNNKAKTLDEIFDTFHQALRDIDLIADAEKFSKKAEKYKEEHSVPN